MHLKLFELLQTSTPSNVAAKLITFAQNNDAIDFQCIILQFFANFVNRSILLTADVVGLNDTSEMVMEIYESEPYENKLETTSTVKDFFSVLLEQGHKSGMSSALQETAWIEFLILLATHEEIPENCAFKVKALQLLSLLINPLAKNAAAPDESNTDLVESLQKAIKVVSTGFSFVALSSEIAEEFVEAMETVPEIFITAENLELYKKLMLKENSALHIIALKSLRKLCSNQDLHTRLEEFFFDESENVDESFRSIFGELLTRKNLKIHVLPLLKAIKNLPSEQNILSDDSRDEIYLNILDSNRKVVGETVELMLTLGDDVWLQVVRLLNTTDEGQGDITTLLRNLSTSKDVDSSSAHLLVLLCKNLEDRKVSQRLASIAVSQTRLKTDEHVTVLRMLDQVLEKCLVDELTFTLILELVDIISADDMIEFYKLGMSKFKSLINCLTTAFTKFDSTLTLHNIINTLAKLTKIYPEHVLGDMRALFNIFYTQFLKTYQRCQTQENLAGEYITLMTKLLNILEYKGWNILNESNYKTLEPILKDLCDELSAPIDVIAYRFYVNFIKQIWVRCILNKPVPVKMGELADDITSLEEGISKVIEKTVSTVEGATVSLHEAFYLVRSVLDILVMFQPTMKELYGHKIFKKASFSLSKEKVKMLGAYVAKAVYNSEMSDDKEEVHKREIVLLSWISFCKNYTNLPSVTASEKIVANYRATDPFKSHMDMLLEHLLTQKSSFEQTVSIVIHNFSNANDSAGFRSFFQALDDFMTRAIKDTSKRSATKLGIGAAILHKLTAHIINLRGVNDDNRLTVLELVKIVVKSLDPSLKVKLLTAIPKELDTIGLTDEEMDFLGEFKAFLRI